MANTHVDQRHCIIIIYIYNVFDVDIIGLLLRERSMELIVDVVGV